MLALDFGLRRHLVQGREPDLRNVLDLTLRLGRLLVHGHEPDLGRLLDLGLRLGVEGLPAADSRISSTAGRRARARSGPGSGSAASGSNVLGSGGASMRGVRWTTGAGSPSGSAGVSASEACSASDPASSNLLITPWPTRASPRRSPVSRWRSSAWISCSRVTKPRETRISPN